MQRRRHLPITFACAAASTALVAVAAWVAAQERAGAERDSPPRPASEVRELHREGSKFEGSGRFERAGDQVAFVNAETEASYRVLENLALERVARMLAENREPRDWNVVGVFTEYQGGNYLLLTRATIKQPPTKRLPRT